MENRHTLISSSISICLAVCFAMLLVVVPCPVDAYSGPGIFILGDSTVDVGTNNFLPHSKARADFPRYGIDFTKKRPTGRFSNGFNIADFIAKSVGVGFKRSPPPFFSLARGRRKYSLRKRSFKGLNFASAGSGLLNGTGSTLGVVPFSEQIQQFAAVQNNITAIRGSKAATAFISKSLFFLSIGSNDLFGYLASNTTFRPEPAKFLSILMMAYDGSIRTLYRLGARKFGIISVSPIGCCPALRLMNGTGGCLESSNELAVSFHSALDNLLNRTSRELPEMEYALGNAYKMNINVIQNQNPSPEGFENVDTACCGFGLLNAEQLCNTTANLCPNRDNYMFWDGFHPTEAAADLAVITLFRGNRSYVTPINFSQLSY